MVNETDVQRLKEEYPEFFEKVSPDLLKFIFSDEASNRITEICLKNGVEDGEKIEKIAYRVILALLEEVPKENLAEILEKGAELSPETARKIYIEINRLIFSQITKTQPEKEQPAQPIESLSPSPEEKDEEPPKKDTYREPIE